MWVSPFRYLRIDGYLLLPAAFRSLSRLSSALSAKASTLRSLCLTINLACGMRLIIAIRLLANDMANDKPYDHLRSKGHEIARRAMNDRMISKSPGI